LQFHAEVLAQSPTGRIWPPAYIYVAPRGIKRKKYFFTVYMWKISFWKSYLYTCYNTHSLH